LTETDHIACILLTSNHSRYGTQILQAAHVAGLDIKVVIIEDLPARGGRRRFKNYWRRYGASAALWRMTEVSWCGLSNLLVDNHRPPTIEQAAQRHSIRVERVKSFNNPSSARTLAQFSHLPALLGGTSILKPVAIQQLPSGILNAHTGLLPDYRGNYPARWALLNGDPCGVSVYQVDDGLDTGPVFARKIVLRDSNERLSDFEERLSKISAEFLVSTALKYITGEIKHELQDFHSGHMYGLMGFRDSLRLYYRLARQDQLAKQVVRKLQDNLPKKLL
jgi:folate-dependent phosphoribosylglycinamide formyltransferase PurN